MYSEMIYLVFCSVQLKSTFLILSDTGGVYTFWPNLDNLWKRGIIFRELVAQTKNYLFPFC